MPLYDSEVGLELFFNSLGYLLDKFRLCTWVNVTMAHIGVHASAEHGLQSAGASDRHLAVRGAVCSERGREAEFAVRPRRVVQRAGAGVRAAVRRSPLRRPQYVHALRRWLEQRRKFKYCPRPASGVDHGGVGGS